MALPRESAAFCRDSEGRKPKLVEWDGISLRNDLTAACHSCEVPKPSSREPRSLARRGGANSFLLCARRGPFRKEAEMGMEHKLEASTAWSLRAECEQPALIFNFLASLQWE